MMMKFMIVAGLVLSFAFPSSAAWSQEFEAGFAKVEITPLDEHLHCSDSDYPDRNDFFGGECWAINMGGYLNEKAKGIGDPLYARSLVLRDANGLTIVLSYLDLTGISNRVIGNITGGVDNATGIEPDNQFIGAIHSHSSPDLQGLYGGVPNRYKRYVESRTILSVENALSSLQPAEMWVSSADTTSNNRRDWGYTDRSITLVEFKQPATEITIGSLLNFAAHPTLRDKDNQISRDFPGHLVDYMEENLDPGNDEDIAIFANGVVGDVHPDRSIQTGDQDAKEYGEQIAMAALATISTQEKVAPAEIRLRRIHWDLRVTGVLFNLAYLFGMLDYDGRWEDQKLMILTKLGYLRFGTQLQAVAFPGESTTRNGFDDGIPDPGARAIKEAMTTDHKLFLGLTGDSLGYFVPSDEWFSGRNNFYEELVSPGKAAGDQARDLLILEITGDPF
jgi:hypothetical protein